MSETRIVMVKTRNGEGHLGLWPRTLEEAEEFGKANGWVVLVLPAEKAVKIARKWLELKPDPFKGVLS